MRAHVEIDIAVEFLCLEEFRDICEPLFDSAESTEPGRNYTLLAQAVEKDIQVVGSAPYKHGCHVDFHLDYNLDPASEPLIFELSWSRESRITIGHATRLQLFAPAEWRDLVAAIGDLPVTFVGLPQSDIYMLGRQQAASPLGAPRGTLRIPHLANEYGVEMAMAVNNAQNAFTPQGSVDPLSLCAGRALFQSATPGDLRTLVQAVTLTSKRAIGQRERDVHRICSAALNPGYDRTTIRAGVVVARRRTSRWVADTIQV
ncbi:Metallo-dependent hydrolase [Mycena olivaceomarginata]|nr:Metallo-dependent hydrolase [Mycena olivaceomarginata]